MMRKDKKASKKPKFPTRLEESMLKRKQQEFVCTCYGETADNVENASIPTSFEDDLSPSTKPPAEGGAPGTADASKDEALQKRITEEKQARKQCQRMHVMYKTPAQVLREMDEERDRMTLLAELTDMIEKKLAKKKEALRKKKLKEKKEKKSKKDLPNWFQELTMDQMKSTEMLGTALMADMEEGCMERTILLIRTLGLKPFPPHRILWDVMTNCYTSPELFLLYLSLCLAPKERVKDKYDDSAYAVRERIILSCLAHLLIPRTLYDLHFLLPPPECLIEKKERVPAHFRLKKKKFHRSPYLQPQPALVYTEMAEIKEKSDKIIDVLEVKGLVNIPLTIEYNEETECQQIQHYIDYDQRRYDHFKEVKKQLKLQATHSYIRMTRTCGDLMEQENTYYRQLSFLPTLQPTFPNETYPFLRFSTSTETPDTSALPQIQELRDQNFIPMMSLRHCATSWDYYPESGLRGSIIPPISHVLVDEETTPVQAKALEGYFHAYPPAPQYNTPRLKPFTRTNPLNSRDFMEYLKRALAYLAQRGNPLAALPEVHLLPHIHKWILKRYRYKMTSSYERLLMRNSNNAFERGRLKSKLVHKSKSFLCLIYSKQLTWDRRDYVEKLTKKMKRRFFGQIQTNLVNDARQFWPVMCMKYYDNPYFRDAFYSYLPSKQSDIPLV